MSLLECVGGHLDGRRFEEPRLGDRFTELLPDGSSRTEYVRTPRRTEDGQALVYCHEALDEVYLPELDRTIAHLRAEFPGHRIDYKATPHSVDFRIDYPVRAEESSLSCGWGRSMRPTMFDVCNYVRKKCKAAD
jgi:hypothetical protein